MAFPPAGVHYAFFIALLTLGTLIPGSALAQDGATVDFRDELEAEADATQFRDADQVLTAQGNVVVRYRGITLIADAVEIQMETGAVDASGNVRLERADTVWTGDEIRGNFRTETFDVDSYNAVSGPWFLRGEGASRDDRGDVVVANAQVSTCEDFRAWRMETKQLTYDPDTGNFRATNVIYKIAGVPMFYLPYAQGHKDVEYQGFSIQPGYRSEWGPYLRVARRIRVTENTGGELGLNWLARRGVLVDGELTRATDSTRLDAAGAWLADSKPPSDGVVGGAEVNRRYYTKDNRYRMRLDQRTQLTDEMTFRGQLDYRSDPDYLWEFHRDEFRENPEPATFANLSLSKNAFSVSATARARVNEFETVVERLPEIRLELPRLPIAGTPLYYQSQNSFAQLRLAARHYDLPLTTAGVDDLSTYSSARADSTHFFFLPISLNNWTLTPRLGGRATWYEKSSAATVNDAQLATNVAADGSYVLPGSTLSASGYDDLGGEQTRWLWEAGVELSTKFHRTWQDLESTRWALSGLRHVVRPYANYTYIEEPNVDRENLYFFDEVDRLRGAHFSRFGIEQRLQTRRRGQIETFARVNVFYDQHLEVPDELEGDEDAGEIGVLAELRPRSGVRVHAGISGNAGDGQVNVADLGLDAELNNGVLLSISYLYRDGFRNQPGYSMASTFERVHDPFGYPVYHGKSHNVRTAVSVPLTARDTFSMRHYFDLDDSRLARHRYEWMREFDCWVGALGFDYESEDYAIFLSLYLKAFPGARVSAGL